jgi:hypothetical protein
VIFLLLILYSASAKYSQAAIHALAMHIQQYHPHLPTLLSIINHLSKGERFTRGMGLSTNGLDFNDFVANIKEALSLDTKEAAHDNCIWALIEWKWQEHTNCSC